MLWLWLGTLLIGFTALAIIAWGWVFWLPVVGVIREDYGPAWGAVAFGGLLLGCVAAAWGLFKLHDRLEARLDPRRAGGPSRLYCQRCGLAFRLDPVVCRQCGSTRFGPAPPARR